MPLIWIFYKRNSLVQELKPLLIEKIDNSADLRNKLLEIYGIEPKFGIRLRNMKGNLVVLDRNLEINTKKNPYSLELYLPRVRKSTISNELSPRKEVT
jgi:hypothetical protein